MTPPDTAAPRAITHSRVLHIALPIVLSNATVPILGAVDTGVVGQMGAAAPIGAVGIGAFVLSAAYWIFGFLRMGTVGLTSQAAGAGDRGEVAALLTRALMIGVAGGLAIILLQLPLFWLAFRLSPASAEVEGLAIDYMQIRIWSAPAAIALYGITGWRDWAQVFHRARLLHMLSVNSHILQRSLLLQLIFLSFIFVGSGFGDVALAANQVLLQFLMITAYAMDGFAFAAEALVGQAMGARARAVLRRAAILTSFWGLVVGVVLAAAFALAGGWIIDLMATSPDVRAAARDYLPYMIAAPVAGWAAWMLDGIFIGATRTGDMRNMMAVSFAVYCLALVVLLPWLGNHGLWLAFLLSFVVRGVTLGLRYPALEAQASRASTGRVTGP